MDTITIGITFEKTFENGVIFGAIMASVGNILYRLWKDLRREGE